VRFLLANAEKQKSGEVEVEWARLIPGEKPSARRLRKKPPQSVKPFSLIKTVPGADEAEDPRDHVLPLLEPRPLQSRMAGEWIRATSVDFILIALDWLAIGALLVPLRMMFPQRHLFQFDAGAPLSLMGIALLHAALITLVGHSEVLHSASLDSRSQTRILGKSIVLGTAVLCFAYWLQGAWWSTCLLFGAAGLLHFAVLALWRRERNHKPHDARNVLIVGASRVGRRIASYLEWNPAAGRTVCGFLDDDRPPGNGILGAVADLAKTARKGFVDEVIVAAPKNKETTQWVLREARRLRLDVEIVPELFGCSPSEGEIEQVGGLPVICLHAERLPVADLVVKRIADIVGAGLALALLSPLLTAIAILIKLDSSGPALYSAPRAGRKGRLFRCHKFRTMVSNADDLKSTLRKSNERSGPFFKMADDPRITRLGRFLRRYSLDELPQLLNVFKGEMSLVGPRPHPLDDVAAYEIEHLARLDVTPGITGLWQVTARRDPSFQRGLELDREYIRTWSLSLDLRILLRTVLTVVQGSGQ
jgi:exopolysaccharide biosynthesis polyprenyl glycosylphosphotransferase